MTHFYAATGMIGIVYVNNVSMPSRANDSFLRQTHPIYSSKRSAQCQCPLGLMTHFYDEKRVEKFFDTAGVNALSG